MVVTSVALTKTGITNTVIKTSKFIFGSTDPGMSCFWTNGQVHFQQGFNI